MASQLIQQTPKRIWSGSKDRYANIDQSMNQSESPIKSDPAKQGMHQNVPQNQTKERQMQPNNHVSIWNSEVFRTRLPVKKLNPQQLLTKMLSGAYSNRLSSENKLCVKGYGTSSLAEKVNGQSSFKLKPGDNLSKSFYMEVTSRPKRMINTPETIIERARSCNSSSRPSRSNAMETLSQTKSKKNTEEAHLFLDGYKFSLQKDTLIEKEEIIKEKDVLSLNLDKNEQGKTIISQEKMQAFLTTNDTNFKVFQEQNKIADGSGENINSKQCLPQNINKQDKQLTQPKQYLWLKKSQNPFVGKNQQIRKSRPQSSINCEVSEQNHRSQRQSDVSKSLVSSPLKCVNFVEQQLIVVSNSSQKGDSCVKELQIKQKRRNSQQPQEQSEYILKNLTSVQDYQQGKQGNNRENEFKRVDSLLIMDGQHITPERNEQFSPINLNQHRLIKKGNSKQSISTVQSSITTKATAVIATAGRESLTDEDKNVKYQISETDNDGEIAMREYIRIRKNTHEVHEDSQRLHSNYQQNNKQIGSYKNTENSVSQKQKNKQNVPLSQLKRLSNQDSIEPNFYYQPNPRYFSLNSSSSNCQEQPYQSEQNENNYNFKLSTPTQQEEEQKQFSTTIEEEQLNSMNNYQNGCQNNQQRKNNSTNNSIQMEKIIHSHFPYRITFKLFHQQQKTSSQVFSELHEKSLIKRRNQSNDQIVDSLNHSIPLASSIQKKYPVFSSLLNTSPSGGKMQQNQFKISQRRTALSFLNCSKPERAFSEQTSVIIESKLGS